MRYTYKRKIEILDCLKKEDRELVRNRHNISEEELSGWEQSFCDSGWRGLFVTRQCKMNSNRGLIRNYPMDGKK